MEQLVFCMYNMITYTRAIRQALNGIVLCTVSGRCWTKDAKTVDTMQRQDDEKEGRKAKNKERIKSVRSRTIVNKSNRMGRRMGRSQ